MTYEYEGRVEPRRTSVGAKMMIFAFAIFAVLGAFWTVVWFIRSYVEQPRIATAAPLSLASRDSRPVPAPERVTRNTAADPQIDAPKEQKQVESAALQMTTPGTEPATQTDAPAVTAETAPPAPPPAAQPGADPNGPFSNRWLPAGNAPAAPQAAAPAPAATQPAAAPPVPEPVAVSDEPPQVVAVMEPAITGPVPTPRRKPPFGATAKRDTPVPRPRPDSAAPSNVWTAVPVQDDRFPQQVQPQ